MKTEHEELVVALERAKNVLVAEAIILRNRMDAISSARDALRDALAALYRARAEPEHGDFSRREALLVALDELFESDFRSIPPDEWAAAQQAFKAARSELQCPDGCDTGCPCYQEGLEARATGAP